MKEGWKYCRLGEVATVTSGNSAPQEDNLFVDGIYPFIRTSDLGRVHRSANFTCPCDYLNDLGIKGLKLFPKGSILIPKSGASTLLNHRVLMGVDSYVVSHLAVITPNEKIISPLYLYYFSTKVDAGNLVVDRAYPSLKTSEIENLIIKVPPLEQQRQIVSELDLLSAVIDKQKSQLKELDTLAQSIFYDMFGDPVENEKGWKIISIGECFPYIKNGANIKQDKNAKGYPITRIETLSNGKFNRDRLGYANIFDLSKYSDYVLSSHDLLVSHINSKAYIGRTVEYISQNNEVIIHGMNLLRLKENLAVINSTYFAFYSNTDKFKYDVARIRKDAVNQSSFTITDFKRIQIPLPPLPLQQQFANKIESIEHQKATISKSIAETQKLFDYTMDKYFG